MSVVSDLTGLFGLTPEIGLAFAAAELDPTSVNVQGVVDAYVRNGQVIPGQMLAYLVQQNELRHPEDLYRSSLVPWLVLGVGAILLFAFKRRKRS